MAVMTEETFGPVIPVMKVASDEEAIKLMNDSEFGLTASIWTKDTATGYDLCEKIEAGTVFVNRCDYPSPVSLFHSMCVKSLPVSVSLTKTVPASIFSQRS